MIEDGVIAAVTAPGASIDGLRRRRTRLEVIDAGGLLVLPGGVDPHVHFDEPGRTDWEGFDSGTRRGRGRRGDDRRRHADRLRSADDHRRGWSRPRSTPPSDRRRVDVAIWGGLVPGRAPPPRRPRGRPAWSASRRSPARAAGTTSPPVDEPTLRRRARDRRPRCGLPGRAARRAGRPRAHAASRRSRRCAGPARSRPRPAGGCTSCTCRRPRRSTRPAAGPA